MLVSPSFLPVTGVHIEVSSRSISSPTNHAVVGPPGPGPEKSWEPALRSALSNATSSCKPRGRIRRTPSRAARAPALIAPLGQPRSASKPECRIRCHCGFGSQDSVLIRVNKSPGPAPGSGYSSRTQPCPCSNPSDPCRPLAHRHTCVVTPEEVSENVDREARPPARATCRRSSRVST